MWYTDAFKWRDGCSPELDDVLNGEWTEAWASDDRMTFGARVHGTSIVDTMSLCWLDSVENRRSELDPEFFSEDGFFLKMFEDVPREASFVEGYHIFDTDDEELVQMGEARIHERVTSHLGELAVALPEDIPGGVQIGAALEYVDKLVFNEISDGRVPGALHIEVFRQRLGLPYEWWGVQTDD